MSAANIHTLSYCWLFKEFAGIEKMFDLAEYPGVPDSRPADHHAIHAKFHTPGRGYLWRVDVTVAKNGDFYARVAFDLADQRPVGNTLVHLRARAAMDSECLDAYILQTGGNLLHVPGIIIPAQAGFYRHRKVRGINDRFGHFHHLVDVLK